MLDNLQREKTTSLEADIVEQQELNMEFVTDNRKHRNKRKNNNKETNYELPLFNHFSNLEVDDDATDLMIDDWNLPLSNTCIDAPIVITQDKHDIDKNKSRNFKTVIVSDSMTKPIDMVEFSSLIENGHAIKRAYGGKTAQSLKHYAYASMKEDKPDAVLICAGTNNLSKKRQTAKQIATEIIEIVKTCQDEGVGKVYVSSIICRSIYQDKINEINHILQFQASTNNFQFIDNTDIKLNHLDGNVHLNEEGINLLANNYLYNINRKPSAFHSVWD